MTINADILAGKALAHYDMPFTDIEFIRGNENLVFSVMSGSKRFVLRIRRPAAGFTAGSDDPVQMADSETAILQRLAERVSFPVQKPVPADDGALFCLPAENTPAVLLEWLDGEPIGGDPDGRYARALGRLAAEIHIALRGLDIPRPTYFHDRISAMAEEIKSAEVLGHISSFHSGICMENLSEIDRVMTCLDSVPGTKSLIHADLGLGNILITPRGPAPIGFSLSGHGYIAHECGILASNYKSLDHWQEICAGYREVSGISIDPHHLDAFFSMSVLLFITVQHGRFQGEEWFSAAMDRWCGKCFRHTIEKGASV